MSRHSMIDSGTFLRHLREEGIETVWVDPVLRRDASMEGSPAVPASGRTAQKRPGGAVLTKRDILIQLRREAQQCRLCGELAAGRTQVVFGSGNVNARLMFVGEAPGFHEDQQGLPFVGEAGDMLTRIIEAMGLTRKKVFIANVLKCRPPENRSPEAEEVLNCEPFLLKQIEAVRPAVICALGTFAAQTLLKTGQAISRLRGRFQDFPRDPSIKVMCTYHPAYLLRNPKEKKKVWEDMIKVRDELKKLES